MQIFFCSASDSSARSACIAHCILGFWIRVGHSPAILLLFRYSSFLRPDFNHTLSSRTSRYDKVSTTLPQRQACRNSQQLCRPHRCNRALRSRQAPTFAPHLLQAPLLASTSVVHHPTAVPSKLAATEQARVPRLAGSDAYPGVKLPNHLTAARVLLTMPHPS